MILNISFYTCQPAFIWGNMVFELETRQITDAFAVFGSPPTPDDCYFFNHSILNVIYVQLSLFKGNNSIVS